ncbi:MAG: hypothetical protein V3S29_07050 [bacterium]
MKKLLLLPAVLLCFAGAAGAQVAAPSLAIAPPNSSRPSNPAVLPWAGPSRVAVGSGSREQLRTTAAGVTSPRASGGFTRAQARWVGERFALAVGTLNVASTLDPAIGGGSATAEFSFASLGFRLNDSLSFGIGQKGRRDLTPTADDTFALVSYGVVWQPVLNIFLGFSTGDESVREVSGSATLDASRSVTNYGVAWQVKGGGGGMHLGFYAETREDTTAFTLKPKEQVTGFVAEISFGPVNLSFDVSDTAFSDAGGTALRDEETQVYRAAWTFGGGLTVSAATRSSKRNFPNGNVDTIDLNSIGLAWLF